MRISDWSSDVCPSDLVILAPRREDPWRRPHLAHPWIPDRARLRSLVRADEGSKGALRLNAVARGAGEEGGAVHGGLAIEMGIVLASDVTDVGRRHHSAHTCPVVVRRPRA